MDLGAYVQIEALDKVAELNGISVPRLRGYRLMTNEEPVDYKEEFRDSTIVDVVVDCCQTHWRPNSGWAELSQATRARCKYYIRNYDFVYKSPEGEGYKKPEVRWDRINGKRKRMIITEFKNRMRKIKEQYEVWNKYCGQPNVLYIHSRIGGANWIYYDGPKLTEEPWFLEKVDDSYDSTYCDIYAKIDPETLKNVDFNKEEPDDNNT